MAESVAERVMREYPMLAFLLRDPEVGPLLTRAVDPNAGFDPATFQAKLYKTTWWRTKSESQRQWEILKHTDPGTAKRRREAFDAELGNLAGSLGVHLSKNQRKLLNEIGLSTGMEPGSAQMRTYMMRMRKGPSKTGGMVDQIRHQIKAKARNEWLVPISTRTADRIAEHVAIGKRDMEGVDASLRRQAANLYPHLRGRIEAGETMASLTDSYRELIAQELEIDPNRIDFLNNPYWKKVLAFDPDGDRKNIQMMTMHDATVHARSRPEWWKTSGGKAVSASMSNSILKIMGKRR